MKLAALFALSVATAALALTPSQERGLHIYLHGTSPSERTITAAIGEGGTPFSAAIVPCVNCHGEDGRGRVESTVRPADITPEVLGRLATVNGRTRPAYTRSHLKRAIGMGIDSGRNALSAAMPRYAMTQEDASDLLDFLTILGTQPQPGITADTIRIGIIGDDTLTAPDARIYGRRIELVHDMSPDVFVRIDPSTLTASIDEQRAALRDYARRIGAEPLLVADCDVRETSSLVLMTSDVAARCDLSTFPATLDRRIIVAAPRPPNAAVLATIVTILADLGRDVTRTTFDAAWQARSHRVWLSTLDLRNERLLAEPGW